MKVDPNTSIQMEQEHVLCRIDGVELFTGEIVPVEDLDNPAGLFKKFCDSLDPNICFISAFVPDRAADEVFYKATEIAMKNGIHMQSNIIKPEVQENRWHNYKIIKSKSIEPEIINE